MAVRTADHDEVISVLIGRPWTAREGEFIDMRPHEEDPAQMKARLDQFLRLVEGHLDSMVPTFLQVIRSEPQFASWGDPPHDQHRWWRTLIKWNVANRLASLARARKNGLLCDDQLSWHVEILRRYQPLVPQMQSLGVRFRPLVLNQINELT